MKTTRPIIDGPRSPIHTPRLLLRPFGQPNDIRDIHLIRSRPEVVRYLKANGVPDADEGATSKWAEKFHPDNYAYHYGFMIEKRDEPGKVIGTCAVHNYEHPEVGYGLHPDVWGGGYATEVLTALVASWWSLPRREYILEDHKEDDSFVEETLEGYCRKQNVSSARVLTKAGFQLKCSIDPNPDLGQEDDYMYEMKRPVN